MVWDLFSLGFAGVSVCKRLLLKVFVEFWSEVPFPNYKNLQNSLITQLWFLSIMSCNQSFYMYHTTYFITSFLRDWIVRLKWKNLVTSHVEYVITYRLTSQCDSDQHLTLEYLTVCPLPSILIFSGRWQSGVCVNTVITRADNGNSQPRTGLHF